MWDGALLARTASSGEGMQHDRRGQAAARASATAKRAAIAAALVAAFAGANVSAARAQTHGSDSGSVWDKMMETVGLSQAPGADANLNYTERSPLVVPPTRDLPAPEAARAAAGPDWPTDPVKRKKADAKKKEAVVPNTSVQTPNPAIQKKPWYNPAGWFDKEEYASFNGEPVRKNLTDPPAGYRVPSPDQPYGLGPDKKPGKAKASASDFALGSATPPPASSGGASGGTGSGH